MAWHYTLDIKNIQNAGKEGRITPYQWTIEVAKEIRKQLPFLLENDAELDDIIWDFENIYDEDSTFDETDETLEHLYDWADNVRCWIRSF